MASPDLHDLLAEARYHRERYELYKAKQYGSRLTSPTRLRELERASRSAQARLRHAQSEAGVKARSDEEDARC
ncbi:MAG: hypothetical protein QOD76_210 [Solirubrobacteraceae bacterium]|nr:hypothetical protein [Solirubrobacteraceae bacterium]